jgi:hypothetical protein
MLPKPTGGFPGEMKVGITQKFPSVIRVTENYFVGCADTLGYECQVVSSW